MLLNEQDLHNREQRYLEILLLRFASYPLNLTPKVLSLISKAVRAITPPHFLLKSTSTVTLYFPLFEIPFSETILRRPKRRTLTKSFRPTA